MKGWALDISEATLSAAVAQERNAQEALCAALMGPVYNLAMRFFGDPDDAADETQEALLHVLRMLPRFEGRSRFSTWCYRVVINRFLNARRRSMESMTVAIGAEALEEGLAWDGTNGPYGGADAQLLAMEVKLSCTTALLTSLSRPMRIAYILGEILDVAAPEAAVLLDMEPAAFRKRLSLARRKVRTFLAPRCGWVDRNNPCRCDRQIAYDLSVGWIIPERLKFATEKCATESATRCLEAIFDEASLYRSHPQYAPPDTLRVALRHAMDTLDDLGRFLSVDDGDTAND